MIILDGKRMGDREALHAELKEKLGLPSYYGGNLDALNDCLGERREETLVVIRDFGDFAENCGAYGMKLLRVFNDNGIQVILD